MANLKTNKKRNAYGDKERQRKRHLRKNDVSNGKLSPKVMTVINHYFANGFHQKEAMLAAGYSETTARKGMWQIFGRPDVKREIERRQQELNALFAVNEQWVVRRLMILADGNLPAILLKLQEAGNDMSVLTDDEQYYLNEIIQDEVVVDKRTVHDEETGEPEHTVAVTERKLKLKGADRLAALNMLARKLGLFKEDDNSDKIAGSVVEKLNAGRNRLAKK